MNVIVIVSDTLRRDHLGCYGSRKVLTPNLDRLASESVLFEGCHHTSFPTVPMRADLFTGRNTFTYLGWQPLPREEVILPQLLREDGYTTLGVVDTPFYVRNGYGYDRGFKDFLWLPGQAYGGERPRYDRARRFEADYCAPRTFLKAEEMLEFYRKEKFFLLVDTWDPHEPWDPPHWYVEPYDPGYDGRIVAPCYGYFEEKGVSEEDIRVAHACYCGEIGMVDHWVGRFLEKLRVMGLWDETAIIFTSDHGYYFGEHGFFGKARLDSGQCFQSPLYREVTRVPLMIRVPGIEPGRVSSLAASVDIMPTILDFAGFERPPTVQGRSLLPMMRREEERLHDFVVSSFPLYNAGDPSRIVDDWLRTVAAPHYSTVTTDRWSFLYSTEADPAELYDLRSDPGESRNVISDHRDVAEDLHGRFVGLLEESGTSERLLEPRRRLR